MLDKLEQNFVRDVALHYWQNKANLTDLQKDIFDTAMELDDGAFDRNSAQIRKLNNFRKYPELVVQINSLPQTTVIPLMQETDEDIQYVLYWQLRFLCDKQIAIQTQA